MNCKQCKKPAVLKQPGLCKEHFITYFEEKVFKTIKEYRMIRKNDKIAVGASGGKDSTTLLYLLKKHGANVTAISIDEGIKGYRDKSIDFLKEFCKKQNIPLKISSFKETFGKDLDNMKTEEVGGMPCTTCGTFRRYLLNTNTKEFNKIAVGHNTDDEAQSVLMNIFKGQIYMLPRTGPVTKDIDGFTQRIKPLYYMKEKEVATYAYLKGFMDKFVECPNAKLAYRIYLRDLLNEYETKHPGTKENILRKHIEISKKIKPKKYGTPNKCEECGEPCSQKICKACEIKVKV